MHIKTIFLGRTNSSGTNTKPKNYTHFPCNKTTKHYGSNHIIYSMMVLSRRYRLIKPQICTKCWFFFFYCAGWYWIGFFSLCFAIVLLKCNNRCSWFKLTAEYGKCIFLQFTQLLNKILQFIFLREAFYFMVFLLVECKKHIQLLF